MIIRSLQSIAILTATLTLSAQAGPTVTALQPGDELRIEYMTTGCFHFSEADLVITDGQIRIDGKKTVPLTEEVARHLETYFAVLDDQPLGACTTTDNLDVTLIRADGTSEDWAYLDARCIEPVSEGERSEKGLSVSHLVQMIDRGTGL